jgi:hypothetical protein
MMTEHNTAQLLRGWALWVQEDSGVMLETRSAMARVMTLKRDDARGLSDISHEQALGVDRAMARLRLHNATWETVLWLTFRFEYSQRRLAGYFNCSRRAAGHLYQDAYDWMDNYLSTSGADKLTTHAA